MNYLRHPEQPERPPVLPKEMIRLPRKRKWVRNSDRETAREAQEDKVLLTWAFCTQTRSTCQTVVPSFAASFTHTHVHMHWRMRAFTSTERFTQSGVCINLICIYVQSMQTNWSSPFTKCALIHSNSYTGHKIQYMLKAILIMLICIHWITLTTLLNYWNWKLCKNTNLLLKITVFISSCWNSNVYF